MDEVRRNQGKQVFKRVRKLIGLPVNREPLPADVTYKNKFGYTLNSNSFNRNPTRYEKFFNHLVDFDTPKD